MILYADRPVRFALQVTADVLAITWIVLWVRAAQTLHDTVASIGGSGALMASAGDAVEEHMGTAAEQVGRVPVAGDALATPFSSVGDAGTSLAEAGHSFQESVAETALSLGVLTAALPALVAVAVWLMPRARWIAQATSARRAGALAPGARDRLLALRALTSVRPAVLAGVHADPVAAWHADDQHAVSALAALELRRLGVRAPKSGDGERPRKKPSPQEASGKKHWGGTRR